MMLFPRTSLKDVAQVILDFRQVRVANKLNLSSRESIYVVGIDFFLSKEIIYRSGMKNIFGMRFSPRVTRVSASFSAWVLAVELHPFRVGKKLA
jgi:hypothetical protein